MARFYSNLTALVVSFTIFFFLVSCKKSDERDAKKGPHTPYTSIPEARYVGAGECRECHAQAFADWLQSDHHRAMEPATDQTVLGDFSGVTFEHFGQRFRFYRKEKEFRVTTTDPGGKESDYKIDYTFGFDPLQQYLIPFPGGRYQALQVCWDSRPREQGGQRWFHLYPDEAIPEDDILHWTKRHFNWNYMCADCHSTDLRKNFDAEKEVYDTHWSEMNVSCEACHGPASVHVKWARAEASRLSGDQKTSPDLAEVGKYLASKGLVVTLKEPEAGGWAIDPVTGKPQRTRPLESDVQVETCARCHSHRLLMEPNFSAGSSYHNTHSPSILSDALYHHDGQMDEEVYVYGSFVQSKMYHAGVRCTDCHHPHTMKTLAPGNMLCVRCHQPDRYDTPLHHFHQPGSSGASCVECHMPTTNYMVVDARRDHSLRIPRPDLAEKLGTPDACTNCHEHKEKGTKWAADAFFNWWGKGPRNVHYGEILAAARAGEIGSQERLLALAADLDRPGIVRATAVEQLGFQMGDPEVIASLTQRLTDPDPNVRKTAVAAFLPLPPAQKTAPLAPLLNDPLLSVRTEAARVLADSQSRLNPEEKIAFDRAAAEFIHRQMAVSDRASGHMALALFYTGAGETEKALQAYRDAKRIEPEFIPARINLAELLFQLNRPREAETEFREAVGAAVIPENEGQARDALARFFIRLKRYEAGIAELAEAARLLPQNPETQYFYAVALNSTKGAEAALPYLEKAIELAPRHIEYLIGAAAICRDGGKTAEALRFARRALELQPGDPGLLQLVRSLE